MATLENLAGSVLALTYDPKKNKNFGVSMFGFYQECQGFKETTVNE